LEHRRKRTARNRTRRLDKQAVAKNSTIIPASLPNLAELIAYGEITVGVLRPIGCVATATDGHNCLAARGESNLAEWAFEKREVGCLPGDSP
jgi:hypothetical protein